MNKDIGFLSKPVSFFWEPTKLCNLCCKHCYTESSPNNELGLNLNDAKLVIDKMYNEGIYSVGIGGGEPLMIPFLAELIAYITSKKMNVSISTNGILLSDKKIKELKNAGLKIIQLSIDGLKDDHEFLRGINTFDSLIDAIDLINCYDIGLRIGCTVNSRNYKNLESFIETMKDNGVTVINFFRYMPYSKKHNYLSLTPEQLMETTSYLVKKSKENVYIQEEMSKKFYITFEYLSFFAFLIDEEYLSHTSCTAGKAKFNLRANGDVSICNYISSVVGNIDDESIEDIWNKIKVESEEVKKIPLDCIKCEYAEYCRGGCKGFSYIQSQGFIAKDLSCFKHLL